MLRWVALIGSSLLLHGCIELAESNEHPSCSAGLTLCGSTCTRLSNDFDNCGACGNRCSGSQFCRDGTCESPSCPANQTMCGGTCTQLTTDRNNCGVCGLACAGALVCQAGVCVHNAYDACNSDSDCVAGTTCQVANYGATSGARFCTANCADTRPMCPARDDLPTACVFTGGSRQCYLKCTPGGASCRAPTPGQCALAPGSSTIHICVQ